MIGEDDDDGNGGCDLGRAGNALSRIPRETFYIGTKVVLTSQLYCKLTYLRHFLLRSQIISKFTFGPGWTLCSFLGEGI